MRAKALIYYSTYIEPCGHAPIEAQFCGTPVITSNYGAFTETILHGITGFRAHTMDELYWAGNNVDKLNPADCRD
jgi:glycosyltransferase involved in cell wall biosynthesis